MQKRKGISLIVLVITIIVMIILASAVIISLNNNEIIQKAKDAVNKTNEKQVQELANIAWIEAYADGKRTVADLTTAIENALKANKLEPEDYYIKVTTSGVTIKDINNVWIQKANRTVVKGDTVLNIGSDILYDETKGGTVTVEKDVSWKVLGAEDGELLIMSTTNIKDNYTLGSTSDLSVAKTDYETGISKLNDLCAPYGKGAYALGARSITVEDVDRVTGYDKTTYGKGTIKEYGNVVTYKYKGNYDVAYESSNGFNGAAFYDSRYGFCWFDENNVYHHLSESDLENAENSGKEIAKVTSSYYSYDVDQETDLAKGTDAYTMLFGYCDEEVCEDDYDERMNLRVEYWLASLSVCITSFGHPEFHMCFAVGDYEDEYGWYGFVDSDVILGENGFPHGMSFGVRAVVRLSSDFNP